MICIMKSRLKIVWKTKITHLLSKQLLFFFKQKYILFLVTYFFKISKNLIACAFFLLRQILKKHRYASAKASNAALVKLTDWILKMIMWLIVRYFSISDKHGQTSNVIWLSTTWLLIFRLEVANKKPLFTNYSQSLIVHELKLLDKKI